jgi:hypothetical protein
MLSMASGLAIILSRLVQGKEVIVLVEENRGPGGRIDMLHHLLLERQELGVRLPLRSIARMSECRQEREQPEQRARGMRRS